MKLHVPKLYSQRDPLWAAIPLGNNTNPVYSIGQYGCLITSLGMYIDKTPSEVNQILKANGGFTAGGGDFIWSKCTVLGISEIYRSPFYSDPVTSQGLSKMRSLLDEGRPLLTHIDFDPRDPDDDMHWLLVYGYDENNIFYALDPWTGTAITLDVYGGVTRCVYEWRAYDKILGKDMGIDEMTQCRTDRDGHYNDKMALFEELGFTGIFNLTVATEKIRQLLALEKSFIEKDAQLQQANLRTAELEAKVERLTKEHNDFALRSTETIQKQDTQIKELTNDIAELKQQITTPVYKGWKKALIDLIGKL